MPKFRVMAQFIMDTEDQAEAFSDAFAELSATSLPLFALHVADEPETEGGTGK